MSSILNVNEPPDLKCARWKHALDTTITKDPPVSRLSRAKCMAQTPWCQWLVVLFVASIIIVVVYPPIVQSKNPERPFERGSFSVWKFSVCLLFISIATACAIILC